jgi:hypothetical protein
MLVIDNLKVLMEDNVMENKYKFKRKFVKSTFPNAFKVNKILFTIAKFIIIFCMVSFVVRFIVIIFHNGHDVYLLKEQAGFFPYLWFKVKLIIKQFITPTLFIISVIILFASFANDIIISFSIRKFHKKRHLAPLQIDSENIEEEELIKNNFQDSDIFVKDMDEIDEIYKSSLIHTIIAFFIIFIYSIITSAFVCMCGYGL